MNEQETQAQVNKAGKLVFQMRRKGREVDYMVQKLRDNGISDEVIQRILFANQQEQVQYKTRQGMATMMIGAIIFLLGCGITIASFALSGANGIHIVAWGAIIWGAIQCVRGYVRYSK